MNAFAKSFLFLSLALFFFANVGAAHAAEAIALGKIARVDVEVTEKETCLFDEENEGPCERPEMKKGVLKTAKASLVLDDDSRLPLGVSTVGRIGRLEHVDFSHPLGNLPGELANLKASDRIYFNQYNLCYRVGLEPHSLAKDARSGGSYYHLRTSRIYVECDVGATPPMVFRKD